MKRIIAFFVSIWIFLFGKKVSDSHKATEAVFSEAKRESTPQISYGNRRSIPVHNNRKNTRGRYTQHIVGEGSSRPIYHDVKG